MEGVTVYAMKEQLAQMDAEISASRQNVARMAMDQAVKLEEVEAEKTRCEGIEKRRAILEKSIQEAEARQKAATQTAPEAEADPKRAQMAARGRFYKTALKRGDVGAVVRMALSHLGAIPAGDETLGGGENFLPTNMASSLITEPIVQNPVRNLCMVSNITGLEEPRLMFEVDADSYDDVTDKQTAKEIHAKGDLVTYGRHKVKVKVRVADTVLLLSDYDIAAYVEQGLRNGLAANEKARLFAESPATAYEHMSFYKSGLITVKQGSTILEAIYAALGDLPDAYLANARIVMSNADWFACRSAMLNTAQTHEDGVGRTIGGYPVTLCDKASTPVVGDFSYLRINYEKGTVYDRDKDVDSGMYTFVLTAWYDIQFRLTSAFRLAKVSSGT